MVVSYNTTAFIISHTSIYSFDTKVNYRTTLLMRPKLFDVSDPLHWLGIKRRWHFSGLLSFNKFELIQCKSNVQMHL